MTVLSATNFSRFHGSGSTGPFTWTWRFLDNDDILVYKIEDPDEDNPEDETRTLLVEGLGYSLTGASTYTGGSLTLTTALASGEDLLVERYTQALQEVDLRNQGNSFFPETHEDVFDRLTMMVQDREGDEDYELAVLDSRVTDMEAYFALTAPSLSAEAGMIVRRVSTLADLRAITGTTTRYAVLMEGRASRGDGGAGLFSWMSSDLSTEVAADTAAGIYVAPTVDLTGATGAWVRQGVTTYNPCWFGAVGNWDGATGTDNLAAFNAMVSAMPSAGGEIKFPIDKDGLNDYLVSDTWNIRKSHVTLDIPRGVTIRSTTVTTHGQTISFAEGTVYGGDDANRLENVAVVGGGTVRNTSSGTNENVIAFSRVKHFACIGMNIPAANRKAITAQVGVTGGRVLRNNIGTCGHAGISIETGEGTTADGYLEILGNHIESAGDAGIQVVGTNSPATDFFAVSIDDNIVESAATDGIYCFRVKGLKLGTGNEVWSAGQRGIRVSTCENVRLDGGLVKTAGYDAVRVASCTGTVHIGPVVVEDANTTASTYSAISLDTNTAKVQVFAPKVGGAGFVYSIISTADYELFGGSLATGTSGYFGTTTPSFTDVLLGGTLRTSRRNPTSAQQGASLSAANGIDYITVTQTGATDVANITGTREGQRVTLLFADGNSTVKDGTGNLRLDGDFVATDQDSISFISNGTQLHETSRSPN